MAVIDRVAITRYVVIPALLSLLLFIAAVAALRQRSPGSSAAPQNSDWLPRAWLVLWAIVLWLSLLQTFVILSLFIHRRDLRGTGGMWLLGLMGIWNVYYSFHACRGYVAEIRGWEE